MLIGAALLLIAPYLILFQVKRSGKDRKGNLEDFDMEKELAELETIKIEEPSNVPSKVSNFFFRAGKLHSDCSKADL